MSEHRPPNLDREHAEGGEPRALRMRTPTCPACAAGSPVLEWLPDAVGGALRNRIRRVKGAIASAEALVVDHRPLGTTGVWE